MDNVNWSVLIDKGDIENQYIVQIKGLENDIKEHLAKKNFYIKIHIKTKLFSSKTKSVGISTLNQALSNSTKFDISNPMYFKIPVNAEILFREAIEYYLDKVIITSTYDLLKSV